MPFLLELGDLRQRTDLTRLVGLDTLACHLEHGVRMQRNVGARPGILCRRKVIGVGLAGYLEDGDRDFIGQLGIGGEPFGIGPGLHDSFGIGIASVCLLLDIVEGIEHQQRV